MATQGTVVDDTGATSGAGVGAGAGSQATAAADPTVARAAAFTCARPTFVLFGDSITQQSFSEKGCWGAMVADAWTRCVDVVNRGFSGYTTRWALRVVPRVFHASALVTPPLLVTIWFGANDSAVYEHNPKQHVPVDEYKRNLLRLVKAIRAAVTPPPRIVLMTPPPVNGAAWAAFREAEHQDRDNRVTATYASAVREAAAESSAVCVDLWSLFQEVAPGDDWHRLLHDGLHLSREGSEITFNAWRKAVLAAWPELEPEGMLYDLPHHADVPADAAELDAAFKVDGGGTR